MQKSTNLQKKKLVQNFEFDPNDVTIVQGYQIINAKNILLNQVFTLKRLSLNDPHNQHKHQTMLKQISILKQLSGINIIKCHKILKSKSHLYLVYDYFSGRNLRHLIDRNREIIQCNKKIDKLMAMKLQEDFVDFLMIQMIGKQLCQVLKEIQSHNIVHMRFWPQNIVLGKNNFIKLANFTHYQKLVYPQQQGRYDQQLEINQYVDSFLVQNQTYGFYTDIYSFGKILQQLYDIFKCSDGFKAHKSFEQLVSKMVQGNSYRRPDLQQVYDFFFGKKRQNQQKVRKSSDQAIKKSTTKMTQIIKRPPSVSSTKSQKQLPPSSTPVIRKSHNYMESHNQPRSRSSHPNKIIRTVQVPESMTRSRESTSVSRAHSQTPKRHSNSPTPTQQNSRNNITALQHSIDNSQSFKLIITYVIKKRNLSMLLLKLGDILATKITGQSVYSLQLVFLLYKKSLIEIVSLAKYLSKGSKKYMPDVTQTNRLRFTKTQEYYMLTKVVNEQLQEQRNMLVSISSLIKKDCPSVLSFNSLNPSLVTPALQQLKPRQTYIPELPDFQKQLKYEAFSNQFFTKTIRKYLQMFVSDLLVMNKSRENAHEVFFYLNLLWEVYRCQGWERFVQEFFEIQWGGKEGKEKGRGKLETYDGLLGMSLRLQNLKKMTVEELEKELVDNVREGEG